MPANYVLLEKITVGAAGASSVTFSGIPQTGYTDLVVKASARSTSTLAGIILSFNGSTANRTVRGLFGTGSSAVSYSGTDTLGGIQNSSTFTASTFANSELYIPNYTSANFKSSSLDGVQENNATAANAFLVANLWSDTSAITSITLTSESASFAQYSTFYLYGVAKLGTTPAIVPYATGGDTIMTDGTYWYHTFISSGTFTPAKRISCDYLVVAGGGAGAGRGSRGGGGGGAGGLRSTVTATGGGGSLESALSLAANTGYTVTVGAGGAGNPSTITSGSNSVFSTITSTGGGAGSYSDGGFTGGSGGGGDGTGTSGGLGTANQGYAGGNGGGGYAGGGGGGAGAIGSNGSSTGGGGNGVAVAITGSSVTYAGGGGGGGTGGGGTGGSGGGGAGSSSTNGTAGTANTGGGGGGSGSSTDFLNSNGGSGIVIVRYAV